MVLTDIRTGSYDVINDVITYNHCRKFGAKYLGNEAYKARGYAYAKIEYDCIRTFL